MEIISIALAGFLAGVFASMGLGGGFVLLLYLSFFTALSADECRLINIIFFLVVGSVGVISHLKHKLIDKTITLKLCALGTVGSIAGAFISQKLDTDMLSKLFGGFLLLVGVSQLIGSFKKAIDED